MLTNFVKFIKTRPPLVLFMICLVFFTFVFFILDQYIKYNEVSNPDTRQVYFNSLLNYIVLNCVLGLE